MGVHSLVAQYQAHALACLDPNDRGGEGKVVQHDLNCAVRTGAGTKGPLHSGRHIVGVDDGGKQHDEAHQQRCEDKSRALLLLLHVRTLLIYLSALRASRAT